MKKGLKNHAIFRIYLMYVPNDYNLIKMFMLLLMAKRQLVLYDPLNQVAITTWQSKDELLLLTKVRFVFLKMP